VRREVRPKRRDGLTRRREAGRVAVSPVGGLYSMLYTVCCILYTVYCMLYAVYCILYTVYCMLYAVYCRLYAVYCMLYTLLCVCGVDRRQEQEMALDRCCRGRRGLLGEGRATQWCGSTLNCAAQVSCTLCTVHTVHSDPQCTVGRSKPTGPGLPTLPGLPALRTTRPKLARGLRGLV
jgi:hypothetical protein